MSVASKLAATDFLRQAQASENHADQTTTVPHVKYRKDDDRTSDASQVILTVSAVGEARVGSLTHCAEHRSVRGMVAVGV